MRVYAGVDVLTGRPHYLKQTIPAGPEAWAQAEKVREEFIAQIEEGRHPRTNATVGELLTKHLDNADLGKRARQSLQGYARKHVHPLKIGISTIGEIGIQVLETFYAELRRCRDHCDGQHPLAHYSDGHRCSRRCRRHVCNGLADATIRKIHFMLSAAFDTGVRWEWITSNPTVGAKYPAPPPPMPKPPTADQAAELVNECWRWSVELGLYVWLAMTTGARRGELCSLRWSDLQAIHNRRGEHDCIEAGCRWILVIDSAIAQSADEHEIWEKDTKTHQHRFVALDPESVALILEFRKVCEQAAEALGITLTDEHFMFAATPEGTDPRKPSSFSNRYQGRARHLGIKTCLKNLRHYSPDASRLAQGTRSCLRRPSGVAALLAYSVVAAMVAAGAAQIIGVCGNYLIGHRVAPVAAIQVLVFIGIIGAAGLFVDTASSAVLRHLSALRHYFTRVRATNSQIIRSAAATTIKHSLRLRQQYRQNPM